MRPLPSAPLLSSSLACTLSSVLACTLLGLAGCKEAPPAPKTDAQPKPLDSAAAAAGESNEDRFAQPEAWVGKALPPLKVEYVDAAPALDGKPMIVEFWATWCPPCRESIPHLNELYSKYKDRGLNIIGISDEEKPTVARFREKLPMNYTVALDPGTTLAQKLGVTGIPYAFIVDKTGKITWAGSPFALKEETIESVL